MTGWFDPQDTLGLRCPICNSKELRPQGFQVVRDEGGNPLSPTERTFICLATGCGETFRIAVEEYMRERQEGKGTHGT